MQHKIELEVIMNLFLNITWWIEFHIEVFDPERNEKTILNHTKFKMYFKVLGNCKKSRTHNNIGNCTQNDQIIFNKPSLKSIDWQIQRCKEYVYPVMIKNLLEIVLFGSLFAKEGLNPKCLSGTLQRFGSLRFWNSIKSLSLINCLTLLRIAVAR